MGDVHFSMLYAGDDWYDLGYGEDDGYAEDEGFGIYEDGGTFDPSVYDYGYDHYGYYDRDYDWSIGDGAFDSWYGDSDELF